MWQTFKFPFLYVCVVKNGKKKKIHWAKICCANFQKGEWLAKGQESGTKFTGIDLNEEGGEWFEYDDKAGEEVSIKDLVWEISRS